MADWMPSEDAVLREHYLAKGAPWCASQVKHTVDAVRLRAIRLGVARRKADLVKLSTPQIDAAIRRAYGRPEKGAAKAVAAAIGRSPQWVSGRANELGLRRRCARSDDTFTPEQDAYIAAHLNVRARSLGEMLRRRHGWRGTLRTLAARLAMLRRAKAETDERLAVLEVAEVFGVAPMIVVGWIRRGWLIADRVEGLHHGFRVSEADIARFVVAHAGNVSFARLESHKEWLIGLIVQHGRTASRQDGSLARRVKSVADANPDVPRARIAEICGVDVDTVTRALGQSRLATVRRAEREKAAA